MSGRPITAFPAEHDLAATRDRITGEHPWTAYLWRFDVEHDPRPPIHHPGAYVLRIAWRGPDGPCHLVRPGDVLTLDPEDAGWQGLRHWPLGDRDDATDALHVEGLVEYMEGHLEQERSATTQAAEELLDGFGGRVVPDDD